MKRLIFVVIVFLAFQLAYSQVPVPEFTNHAINDYANLIDDRTESELNKLLQAHKDSTTVEMVVLTYNDIESESIDQFANRVFNIWGVGNKKTNNGVMFILTLKPTRKYRTEVGGGLEGILTDALTKRYAESIFKPKAQSGDVSGGVSDLIKAYIQETSPEYRALKAEEEKQAAIKRAQDIEAFKAIIPVVLFVIGIALVISFGIGGIRHIINSIRARRQRRIDNYNMVSDKYEEYCCKLDKAIKNKIPNAELTKAALIAANIDFFNNNPKKGSNPIYPDIYIDKFKEICKNVFEHYDLLEQVKILSRKITSTDLTKLSRDISRAINFIKKYDDINIFKGKSINFDRFQEIERDLEKADTKFRNSISEGNLSLVCKLYSNAIMLYTALKTQVDSIFNKVTEYENSKNWVEKNESRVSKYAKEHSDHHKVSEEYKKINKMQKSSIIDYIGLATAMGILLNIIPSEEAARKEAERAAARRRREEDEYRSRSSYSSSSSSSSSSGGGMSLGGGSSFGGGSSGNW